jgi:predicted house-cleaning noncanonical NTP pyrophosphatase (MazG superfamily)
MAKIEDVRQLTRDELSEIIRKGENKAFIKLCIKEEDRRKNILLRKHLEEEARIAEQLGEKAG